MAGVFLDPHISVADVMELRELRHTKIEKHELQWAKDWQIEHGYQGSNDTADDDDSVMSMKSITSMHMEALRNHELAPFQWKGLNIWSQEHYADLSLLSPTCYAREQRVVDWSHVDSFQEGIELRYGTREGFDLTKFRVGPPSAWQCMTVGMAERVMNAQLEALEAQGPYLSSHLYHLNAARPDDKDRHLRMVLLRPRIDHETAWENYLSCLDQREQAMKANRRLVRANKCRIMANREQDTRLFNASIDEWTEVTALISYHHGEGADGILFEEDVITSEIIKSWVMDEVWEAVFVMSQPPYPWPSWMEDSRDPRARHYLEREEMKERRELKRKEAEEEHKRKCMFNPPPRASKKKAKSINDMFPPGFPSRRTRYTRKAIPRIPSHVGSGAFKCTHLDDDSSLESASS